MPTHKRVWAQSCVGTIVCGHNRVWAQSCVGTIVCGHNRVWAQSCVGTIVCGHNRVWAQSCVGTIVWAQACMDSSMYGTNVWSPCGSANISLLVHTRALLGQPVPQ